jgi:hypothetical protein
MDWAREIWSGRGCGRGRRRAPLLGDGAYSWWCSGVGRNVVVLLAVDGVGTISADAANRVSTECTGAGNGRFVECVWTAMEREFRQLWLRLETVEMRVST